MTKLKNIKKQTAWWEGMQKILEFPIVILK